MSDLGRYCSACGTQLELKGRTVRRDECPSCGAELHACVNCQHYDAQARRGCREPNAVAEETVRDATRANLCDWFDHRHGKPVGSAPATPADAQRAFDALFGGPKLENSERSRAEEAFGQLFKR